MTVAPLAKGVDLERWRSGDADMLVGAADGAVRRYCGWHIAPSVTETVTVDSTGSRTLLLPSMYVTAVTAVRDITDDTVDPVVLDGWRSTVTPRFRAGVLERRTCWPRGVLEVDLAHGYAEVPAEVQAVVLDLAEMLRNAIGGVTRRQVGAVSAQWADEALAPQHKLVLDGYKIPAMS